ncbi:MAG: tRNA pseudouridine(38-40) synthase TruA [Dehalococcoidales bacterium]|nr:tRNA pseudouridine(38-40) synthase TruA [Dehalococcoidales bacterium]
MTARTEATAADTGVAATTKIVLVVEYEGTRYYGFQWQANLPTVQAEIETAVEKLTGEKLRIAATSRTDTGVHASGQVVSFRTTSSHAPDTFVKGLNFYLPQDIAVKAAYKVEDSFDVRRQATSREYQYRILNSTTRSPLLAASTYRVMGRLNVTAMNEACRFIIGEHDLASFASDLGMEIKSTTRRIIKAEFSLNGPVLSGVEGELVTFDIEGSSFLPHQVRNTVGALIRVGQGKINSDEFSRILEAKKIGLAGPIVPACGLCLTKVNYPHNIGEEK